MTDVDAALTRISIQVDENFAVLEANGTSAGLADRFAAFLADPSTLDRPSLVVRCRQVNGSFACDVIVDKPFSRTRLVEKFLPYITGIRERLPPTFDIFVLISDTIYVCEQARPEFVAFLRRVPFLRCDWLAGDAISQNAIIIPDYWLQDPGFDDEVAQICRATRQLPFAERQELIAWRGALTGPDYPDIDNCVSFPRYQLLRQARKRPDIIDARLTHYNNIPVTPAGEALRQQLDEWFGGIVPPVPAADFGRFKYLVSTDGVAATWKRVATILWTGSVLLMQNRWRQFFYPGLVEWEHYVPLSNDLSDLIDRYAWLRANPIRAAEIARSGQEFASRALTRRAIDDHFLTVLRRCAQLRRT